MQTLEEMNEAYLAIGYVPTAQGWVLDWHKAGRLQALASFRKRKPETVPELHEALGVLLSALV